MPGAGLDMAKRRITQAQMTAHVAACKRIKEDTAKWTSHTVIVVDQSGSMRRTDVEGGATRSDAVWLTLAVDFVAKHLETQQSTDTDVVSVVAMCQGTTVLIDRQPHDWLLFNSLIDLLRSQEPHFDGNYVPALDAAEQLLLSNSFGSCALTLFFLSDGKPSDQLPPGTQGKDTTRSHISMMAARIDALASRFGRRLTVLTVGFAGPNEDFRVLQKLAERSSMFGSNGKFIAARLNAEALGVAFSSITSSLNATRSELTAIGGSSQRAVRDVRRRARDTVGIDPRPNSNWLTYMAAHREWGCERLSFKFADRKGFWDPYPPLSQDACGVAMARDFFGEGAERLVREFREVGPDGRFVGPLLVAKESRFQVDVAQMSREATIAFHRSFCDTQHRARRLAEVFNEKLATIPGFDPLTTPMISFLECSVYLVKDKSLGNVGVLVEKQLDPTKYKKWNDNQGMVDGQAELATLEPSGGGNALERIIESDEDEDEDDDELEDEGEAEATPICIEDIPQAFSHFTHRYTKRKLLVCDLQGVLSSSPRPQFEFTDPVVHFSSRTGRRNVFGRTDRGWQGINDFLKTHKCSPLCDALNRRWVRKVCQKQQSSHLDGLEEQLSNVSLG